MGNKKAGIITPKPAIKPSTGSGNRGAVTPKPPVKPPEKPKK